MGVARSTGIYWRHGRTVRNTAGEWVHHPHVHQLAPPKPRHPRYLSRAERTTIADLWRENTAVRQIAREIGRSPSTVSRELRRNIDSSGRYRPRTADQLAIARRPRPRARRLVNDLALRQVMQELLGRRWSPEQVAHELSVEFPGAPQRWLCTESIYQAIYDPDVPVTRPAKRRRRVQGLTRRGRLSGMTMIADRPAEVDDRVQAGHWEGDCIMGAGNRSAIATLVERRTRYLLLMVAFDGKPTAEAMRDSIVTALLTMPPQLRRTLTWDQGKELALHPQITEHTGTQVFFCDAHSPWRRGSNENMNGLLRDYFPKGVDLSGVSPQELQRVADEVNDRPRKSLGWAEAVGLDHPYHQDRVVTKPIQPQKVPVGSRSISASNCSTLPVGRTRS